MTGEQPSRSSAHDQWSALGQVMGELAHDLANEITVLHGWALLARGEADAGRLASVEMERVVEISAGLGQMLRDVLATVAGQALSPEVRFDPASLTEEALERRVRALSGLSLRFQSELPRGIEVAGRPSFWTRILVNLLSNATRYARRRIDVVLRLEEGAGRSWVVLRVEDDGRGVEAHRRHDLFQPLSRGEEGETGLGLSSTAWSVAQLGGEVSYADEGSLGGATFVVRVPATAPLVRARPADAPAEVSDLRGVRLLLVEDDPAVRLSLVRLLRRVGADVRGVDPEGEPEEHLLQSIVRAVPEAVLLDLRLGERGGVALWRRMCAEMPALAARVVFVTGATPEEAEWREAEATGQPLLGKPFDLRQLAAAVARLRAGE